MSKRILLTIGLFLIPAVPILAAAPVNVPEYWGGSDWLGFFALAAIAIAIMIRMKLLKPLIGL